MINAMTPSNRTTIFVGTNGLRAGWRLLIFLAVLISCLLGFREVVVHIPTVTRMLQPLREGRLVVSAALVAEFQFVLSLLIAVSVMSRIERRSLADYGLPARDAFGRYFWQGLAWRQSDGVRSRVGDCVPHGGVLRRVSVSWLPPVHIDYGYRVLALGNSTFYCVWLRSSRQSRRKLDGRCDGGAVWIIPLFYAAGYWQLVVRARAARQFCVRRDIHLLGPKQRVYLLRTPAQLYAPRAAMVDGRFSRPGGQRNDVCCTRPLVRAVRGFRTARVKPPTGLWMNRRRISRCAVGGLLNVLP